MDISESDAIATCLDRFALSSTEIEWRRKMWRNYNYIMDLPQTMQNVSANCHVSGSMAEGVGTKSLGSDLDIMICAHYIRVIQRASDWELQPGIQTVLLDTSNIHPGYCRLKIMNIDEPTFINLGNECGFPTYDGVAVLPHWQPVETYEKSQGPARTIELDLMDFDKVLCIRAGWPPDATEWLQRHRLNAFPPSEFVSSAAIKNIHIVPTGYKNSCLREIEWRFSFSLLEKEIIWMWPINTLRCYALLKLLKKHILKRSSLPHTLCSYHIKTLLFWMVEETGVKFWNEHCLLDCLGLSLAKLLKFVEHRCIPHYFIKENNLFDREIGEDTHSMLMTSLQGLAHDKSLLYRACWSVIRNTQNRNAEYERYIVSVHLVGVTLGTADTLNRDFAARDTCTMVKEFTRAIDCITSSAVHCDEELSLLLLYLANSLRSKCCTCILSVMLRRKMSNPTCFLLSKISEKMLRQSTRWRPVQLLMAHFYYQTGRYRRATRILETVPNIPDQGFCEGSVLQNLEKILQRNRNHLFLKREIHTTPYSLQFAMFENCYTYLRDIDEHYKSFHAQDALVDSEALQYYLQYLCYSRMGEDRHAQVAMDNLEWVATYEKSVHKETTWNLLGDCYRNVDLRHATECFVKSLCMEPRNTAALVQLAITLETAARNQ